MKASEHDQLQRFSLKQLSFPVIHKAGNVDNFVLPKFANKYAREINHFNYLSKHY